MGSIKLKATDWAEAKQELLANYSIEQIVGSLAGYILAERNREENPTPKVSITMEQLEKYFNVKNPEETRGRKKQIVTEEDKAAQKERILAYQKQRYWSSKEKEEK